MSPLLLSESPTPPCLDANAHTLPRLHLYAFPLIDLLPAVLAKVHQQGSIDSASLAYHNLVLGDNIPPRRLAFCNSDQEGPSVSGAGNNNSSPAQAV